MVGLNCSGEYIDFANGVFHSRRCTYLKQIPFLPCFTL